MSLIGGLAHRVAVRITGVRIGTASEKSGNHASFALLNGLVERIVAVFISHVGIGPTFDQSRDNGSTPLVSRSAQRCPASVVQHVWTRTMINKSSYYRGVVAMPGSSM